jgi:hypothetical protein
VVAHNVFTEEDLKDLDDDIDRQVDDLAKFLFKHGKISGKIC